MLQSMMWMWKKMTALMKKRWQLIVYMNQPRMRNMPGVAMTDLAATPKMINGAQDFNGSWTREKDLCPQGFNSKSYGLSQEG
ncbi:uncharacterized protein LOC135498973 isoform X3 [Lineus longissimus]|uniref:uncharacterized protein LOC135498840 isoform X3 n=1 Tax=Lineus longissimus TaxID=88925 RepID=UPI00315DA10C